MYCQTLKVDDLAKPGLHGPLELLATSLKFQMSRKLVYIRQFTHSASQLGKVFVGQNSFWLDPNICSLVDNCNLCNVFRYLDSFLNTWGLIDSVHRTDRSRSFPASFCNEKDSQYPGKSYSGGSIYFSKIKVKYL